MAGRELIKIAAPTCPQCTAYFVLKKPVIISVIGCRDCPRQKILNVLYSFHIVKNNNVNFVVIPDFIIGSIMLKKHLIALHPSSAAASSNSYGMDLINAPINRTVAQIFPVTQGITTAQIVPISPRKFKII